MSLENEFEPTWENQLNHARKQNSYELTTHALVSTRNQHRCKDCYCCAALTILETRLREVRIRKGNPELQTKAIEHVIEVIQRMRGRAVALKDSE